MVILSVVCLSLLLNPSLQTQPTMPTQGSVGNTGGFYSVPISQAAGQSNLQSGYGGSPVGNPQSGYGGSPVGNPQSGYGGSPVGNPQPGYGGGPVTGSQTGYGGGPVGTAQSGYGGGTVAASQSGYGGGQPGVQSTSPPNPPVDVNALSQMLLQRVNLLEMYTRKFLQLGDYFYKSISDMKSYVGTSTSMCNYRDVVGTRSEENNAVIPYDQTVLAKFQPKHRALL
uniref:Uncharacterized protein n=1 Tax=Pseudodiaptomus poplesia TaxID=213370 RepID=A0A1S6GL80_9MAXI|nr:hypothetical protein [Pseudodiaptomus poplesia]